MNTVLEFIYERKYIEIVIIVAVIIFIVFILSKKRNKSKIKTNRAKSKKEYTLEDCKSYEDLEFKIDAYQNNLKKELSKNKQIIQNAKNKGYIKANIVWTERFQELTDISNTLYKNLEYENARKLNKDKFHRYTSLHFRSFILGNLAYKDYMDSKKVRDEIGQLLVDIGKKKVQVTAAEKRKLYDVKDTCVKTTKYLYDRMIAIQSTTRKLKYKIRDECGSRGKAWFKKIEKNKNK